MEIFPNYTENVPLMPTSDWKSDDTFTYTLLSKVYKVANRNLHSVFPNYNDLKVCKINEENLLDFEYCGESDVGLIIEDFQGPTAYIGVWLALTLIWCICGILWCICNKCCCCNTRKKNRKMDYLVNTDSDNDDNIYGVGGTSNKDDSRKQVVMKVVVAVLMGLLIIGLSFSVFMSFASNENLRKSVFELYDDVNLSLDDAKTYLETSKLQIEATFVTSYSNLSNRIEDQMRPVLDAVSVANRIDENVIDIWTLSNTLLVDLERNLNHVKNESDLRRLIQTLYELQSVLKKDAIPFTAKIGKAERDIVEAIAKTGKQLQDNAKNLTDALDDIPIDDIREEIQNAENNWLDVVGSAVYGSFMGFNLILLMILIGIVIGSVVTWIGKGSAKKTGFIFYRFSIVVMFIFGWVIAFLMLTQFAVSGYITTFACEGVEGLDNSTLPTRTLQRTCSNSSKNPFEIPAGYKIPTYSHIVNNCKLDQSAYISFQLEQVYEASSICDISDNFINLSSLIPPNSNLNQASSVKFFIKNANTVYYTLYKNLAKLESFESVVTSTVLSNSNEILGIKSAYSKIKFILSSVLQEIKILESGDFLRVGPKNVEDIIALVNHYEEFVYTQVHFEIGRCKPLHKALNATLHTFCYKVLAPVVTYWWSLQLLLIICVAVICTALISERIFKKI